MRFFTDAFYMQSVAFASRSGGNGKGKEILLGRLFIAANLFRNSPRREIYLIICIGSPESKKRSLIL